MNYFSRNLKYIAVACVAAAISLTAVNAFGQEAGSKEKSKDKADKMDHKADYKIKDKGFCGSDSWSNGDRVSHKDLRELTVASTGTVSVDAGPNGGISVKGEDRGDVAIRACIQASGATEDEARALAASVRINTSGEIKADTPAGEKNWSVSYQILVPRSTNTKLKAHNGGISLSGVDGNAEFETQNGGVNVSNVAGFVKGRTANGGVNVSLAGTSWKGSGLDVETKNGGVNLTIPENYAANVETGTVNGGFKSDIPSLSVTTENLKGPEGRSRASRVSTSLNGGGAPIRVITTNGGIKINKAETVVW